MTKTQKYFKIVVSAAYLGVVASLFLPVKQPRKMPAVEVKKVQAIEVAKPTPTPIVAPVASVIVAFPKYLTDYGAKNREKALEWMTARWSSDNVTAFDNILKKESGYRADAVNEIGAGGICQAYPASKMPCNLSNDDLMCQLQWCNDYIERRYGTPANAWEFHLVNNWF